MNNQSASPNASMPLLVAAGLIGVGLIIGVISGLSHGSIVGGLLALAGLVPASYSAWLGIQKETQTTLLYSILLALAALGVGGLLTVLWLISAIF